MPTQRNATRPAAAGVHRDRSAELISRAVAHVDAHLDQALDAPLLARQAAMSVHHFHRVFHAHTGCSVGNYVTWRRLQRACALLASGRESVLEIALAVGYESSQALAKAMRRDLGATPGEVRRGDHAPWTSLLTPKCGPPSLDTRPTGQGDTMTRPTRHADLPDGIEALTATARGMVDHRMTRAAQAAFGELMGALARHGLQGRIASCMSIVPDDPNGPDDPHCRYVAGVVFGYRMADGSGRCERPEGLARGGRHAWQPRVPGRPGVGPPRGPDAGLTRPWRGIYRDWLPASGEKLRDAPPMELCLNDPSTTPPAELLTEIWIPVE